MIMDKRTQKAIEAAGFAVSTVRDFLDLTDAENELVELRVAISRAVRAKRESAGVTQSQLAERVESSQPRIAKIEAAAPGVSLDLMFKSYFALGGTFAELAGSKTRAGGSRRQARPRKASRTGR
jgi:DNA-binding XRE family transcriptional regulator